MARHDHRLSFCCLNPPLGNTGFFRRTLAIHIHQGVLWKFSKSNTENFPSFLDMQRTAQSLCSLVHCHFSYQIKIHFNVILSSIFCSIEQFKHFDCRWMELQTNSTVEPFIENISLGCIYVTRCWSSYCRWFQSKKSFFLHLEPPEN